MSDLGYSGAGAEDLIRLWNDPSEVALRINDFVPQEDIISTSIGVGR
ncbi:hypothetical protein ACRAWB_16075 [Leifsonia poae]